MATATINLDHFRTTGSKVFTGRDRGKQVRIESKIDELIDNNSGVEIIIPEDIRSINPSFLEEFLFNAVRKLGKILFFQKVRFTNPGKYHIGEDIEEAVDSILREKNALSA
jgi:hypothetical protein